MKRGRTFLFLLLPLLLISPASGIQKKARRLPGEAGGGFLLPNGWTITPAGEQVAVGDLPLALVLHPDGRHLLVADNGYSAQSVDVIDISRRKIVSRAYVDKAWLGLDVDDAGSIVYAGGGIANSILRFSIEKGKIRKLAPIPLGNPKDDIYPGGICTAAGRLYAADNLSGDLSVVDPAAGEVLRRIPVGDHPYTCAVAPDGKTVWVSIWGGAEVAAVDTRTLTVSARVPTDDHPNAMVFSKEGDRLFVANANSNTITAIDVEARRARERISVALYPSSPAGSTTNALAIAPDGRRLYAANADNNDVAVVDISDPSESRILGFIPVGWYPTALALSRDGKTLFVANGKGSRSYPNPEGPQPTKKRTAKTQFIGRMQKGTVSIIPLPDAEGLRRYTARVFENIPYSEKNRLRVPYDGGSAVPKRVGDPSPIRHVIYVIKENRTYDQLFGDMPEGNGDARLTLFGEKVTPNHHALAREFVLLDNFYADAEVSADGHNWSMGAYATDYVEKTWPSQYSRRRKTYDYEGVDPIAAPSMGYIWDACRRAGIPYRSYGEWVVRGRTHADPSVARPGALEGHIDPEYRGWDLSYSDIERAKRFLSELRRYEAEGEMPRLQVVRLGNDHTQGTTPGALTPRAYVAQNDLALGMLVEGVSHSRFWPTTAVFVLEDDAQNGPDHVDAHRTVALAVSPYIRRKTVDSTMYSTSGMLRTIELILGLPPMSQYDAAATPMFSSFGTEADATPYDLKPARVSLTEVNPPDAPGAARSRAMDFEEADAAPDVEFNEIIWKSVKGGDAVMPAPVRSSFCRGPKQEP